MRGERRIGRGVRQRRFASILPFQSVVKRQQNGDVDFVEQRPVFFDVESEMFGKFGVFGRTAKPVGDLLYGLFKFAGFGTNRTRDPIEFEDCPP